MKNLLEELHNYEELTSTKESLNKELKELSGKNDPNSINRINEIAAHLNQINEEEQKYNKEDLDKVAAYHETMKEFNRLTGELQTIEKLSKKSKGEKSRTTSSEGRPKYIDNSLLEEYNLLAEQKKSLRSRFNNEYKALENITSLVKTSPSEIEVSNEVQVEKPKEYTIPLVKDYKDLTDEEKIKELEDRLQRIINSSKLPNQGQKDIITYNGKKYPIPEAYHGIYNETIRELNTLKNKMSNSKKEERVIEEPSKKVTPKETFETKLNEIYPEVRTTPKTNRPVMPITEEENPYIYGHYDPKPKPITLPDLIQLCDKNKIKLHPVPVTFKRKHKINIKKAYTAVKSKVSLETFKKILPKVWNIDKNIEYAFVKMNGKLLDKEIILKTKAVKFANSTIQKYNTAKSYVTKLPKRTKNYIKDKYNNVKKFFQDKKEIVEKSKEGKLLDAMKEVYGKRVESHLDYKIVNRTTNFKENTCQRIRTAKGKITNTTKAVVEAIKKPFDYLRENMKNDIKRQEMQVKIDEIRKINQEKKAALTRIKANPNIGGYVGTVTIIVVGVIILAAIIFMGIGTIINR